MVSMYFRILSISLTIALLLVARVAATEPVTSPVPEEVKALYLKAHKQLEIGAYEQAYENFERAYKLSNNPYMLYKMALTMQLGTNPEAALALYDRVLSEAKRWQVAPEEEEEKKKTCADAIKEAKRVRTELDEVNALSRTADDQLVSGTPEQAYKTYERAYQRSNTPRLLYKMARAKQLGKHLEEALALYDRVLSEAKHWRVPPAQEELKEKTCGSADTEAKLIRKEIDSAPTTELDSAATQVELKKLQAQADDDRKKIEEAQKKLEAIEVTLRQPPAPPPPSPLRKRPWFISLMVGVGIAVAIGVPTLSYVVYQNQPPTPPVGDLPSRTINF